MAIDEDKVLDRLPTLYANPPACGPGSDHAFWTRTFAINPNDGYKVRYSRFGCAPGAKGAIVIAPGRTEPAYEYYETALDFIALGYGPIYAVDHRGQGLSPRLLTDPLKGHVDRFEDYIDDFTIVVDDIQKDLSVMGAGDAPLFFTSNSLGGAIGIGYFQALADGNPFDAATLLGPMIHVNYISFVDTDSSRLALRIYSERGASLQANVRCRVVEVWRAGKCTDYANVVDFGPYVEGSRNFIPDNENMMTHSKARFDLRSHMWDRFDWSEIAASEYAQDEYWPGPQLGGATNGWVLEGAHFNREMRKEANLARMTNIPVLLMTGTRDLRAYRQFRDGSGRAPDLIRHSTFCDRLNDQSQKSRGTYSCFFLPLNGAFHELYKERDHERNAAIAAVDWFFQTHSPALVEATD